MKTTVVYVMLLQLKNIPNKMFSYVCHVTTARKKDQQEVGDNLAFAF